MYGPCASSAGNYEMEGALISDNLLWVHLYLILKCICTKHSKLAEHRIDGEWLITIMLFVLFYSLRLYSILISVMYL
jgi:hypothetical protein